MLHHDLQNLMTQKACHFIDEVRELQQLSGRPLRGPSTIKPGQKAAIDHTIERLSLSLSFHKTSEIDALETLLCRFEEMCRRRNHTFKETLRLPISQILIAELMENVRAFKSEGKIVEMVPLTLYQGTSFIAAMTDPGFDFFNDKPDRVSGIFKYAAKKHPTDPCSFLQNVIHNAYDMERDPEYHYFSDVSWAYRYAAINRPENPREFLMNAMAAAKELAQDEDIKALFESEKTFKFAAIMHPTNPRGYLEQRLKRRNSGEEPEPDEI